MGQRRERKNIVVIGGGNGTVAVLRALRNEQDVLLSAVVSVADAGGSSGILRRELGVLPPGDMLRAVLALSPYPFDLLKRIFYSNRFSDAGKLDGHNLGNLFLTLGAEYGGDFLSSLSALHQAVEAKGRVFPATLELADFAVRLQSGVVLLGEDKIDRPTGDRSDRIMKAWLEPRAVLYDEARRAIEEADYIILSPGSLYTSVIATLLPEGMKEAIANSCAKIIFCVPRCYEIEGEAGPRVLSEFVLEVERYLPRSANSILYNSASVTEERMGKYNEKKWGIIETDPQNLSERLVFGRDYESVDGGYDVAKLTEALREVLD